MKNNLLTIVATLICLILTRSSGLAQGTAFTYQGRLTAGANPANGSYDLRFAVFDNGLAGSQQGPALTNSATAVSNGLFTVTLDFGATFPGAGRWLEIAVRTNGTGGFNTLSPRQPLTPSPYAITAGNIAPGLGLSGTYGGAVTLSNSANQFTGGFSGNGANVTSVNAATLGGLPSSNLWQLGGNNVVPGQFLGSANNQPLELWANGQRAFRLEPTATDANHSNLVNVIGGSSANFVLPGVYGATISGGGAGFYSFAPFPNTVTSDFGTVGGGVSNSASGYAAVVGGGQYNTASDNYATVGGGQRNTASVFNATVGGGYGNTAGNQYATVPGGYSCVAAGFASFAAGDNAEANHLGAFVWADSSAENFASTAINQFLIRANGGVGIGTNAPNGQLHVASSSGAPQVHITQNNSSDFTRLRMNVADWPGSPFWEMDVSPSATPSLQWWNNVTERMSLDYNGNLTTSGSVSATGFNTTSDRNAKEKFTTVSSREVLDKVAALPISEWNLKQEPDVRHIGPMAQDFYAAFSVGMDDKHIATVDEGGVALAAIQGLNQKLEAEANAKDARIEALETALAKLQQRVARLDHSK